MKPETIMFRFLRAFYQIGQGESFDQDKIINAIPFAHPLLLESIAESCQMLMSACRNDGQREQFDTLYSLIKG